MEAKEKKRSNCDDETRTNREQLKQFLSNFQRANSNNGIDEEKYRCRSLWAPNVSSQLKKLIWNESVCVYCICNTICVFYRSNFYLLIWYSLDLICLHWLKGQPYKKRMYLNLKRKWTFLEFFFPTELFAFCFWVNCSHMRCWVRACARLSFK